MSFPVGQGEEAFGFGWNEDGVDPRDWKTEDRIGSFTTIGLTGSMMQHRFDRIYQGAAPTCVAHALARAINMLQRARGYSDPPFPSRRFIYGNSIRQEVREAAAMGISLSPVFNRGSFPRHAMRAVQRLGFPDESFFPYSSAYDALAETPMARCFQLAFDQEGLRYSRIASTGRDRCALVAESLRMGRPVIWSIFADTAFMQNKGETIASVNDRDPNGGGHMLCLLEVAPNGLLRFDNWWSVPGGWGDDEETGWIDPDLFGSEKVRDVYSLEYVENFSEVA